MSQRFMGFLGNALGALSTLGLNAQQAAAQLNRFIDQQAFTRAAADIFLASAVLFLALIAVVWLTRPVQASGKVDTGGAH
jgi:DHA2 family multidrug resistance protein